MLISQFKLINNRTNEKMIYISSFFPLRSNGSDGVAMGAMESHDQAPRNTRKESLSPRDANLGFHVKNLGPHLKANARIENPGTSEKNAMWGLVGLGSHFHWEYYWKNSQKDMYKYSASFWTRNFPIS